MASVLSVPDVGGLATRVITVPREVHQELAGRSPLPFYQMLAKNVGIRRASGHSVLATNIDVLLSDALFLATTGPIADRCVYRADRIDVPFAPSANMTVASLRSQSPIRRLRKGGLEQPGRGLVEAYVVSPRTLGALAITRPRAFLQKVWGASIHNGPAGFARIRRGARKVFGLPQIHGNACGDYTLMTRASWEEIRGYPEWIMHSWNLDSLLLYQAACAGYSSVEFSEALYHLEHSGGWAPNADVTLFAKLIREGVPFLTTADLIDVAHSMWHSSGHADWKTNTGAWGFIELELQETSLPFQRARPRTAVGDPL